MHFLNLAMILFSFAQTQAPTITFPQIVEIKEKGTRLYSLYDENSPIVRELNANELLIAHGQKAGWYEVEVPAGFPCWIFSKYIKEGSELGKGVVSDDRVNVRPIASSEKNYPMGRVNKGDELLVLDHKGEWTQIQAPSSIHAWIKIDTANPLGEPNSYSSRLDTHRKDAQKNWNERLSALEKQREVEKQKALARASFEKAEKALDQERAKGAAADFTQVRVLYAEAMEKASDASLKEQIKNRLDTIASIEALAREKESTAELEKRAQALDAQLREARTKAFEEAKAHIQFTDADPLRGRYTASGWVRRSLSLTRGYVYTLEKGGVTLFEISCANNRYQLSDFLHHEIGVKGEMFRDPNSTVQRIEIEKMEVLAAQ